MIQRFNKNLKYVLSSVLISCVLLISMSYAYAEPTPVYITNDNINNTLKDTNRINELIIGLTEIGIPAYNAGIGPNKHITVLQDKDVPPNAIIINIFGGADAGLIYEKQSPWYKHIQGTRIVYTIYVPPAKDITGLEFLERAHDDNYSPKSFKGLNHPDIFLKNQGYEYLYTNNTQDIINKIQHTTKNI